MKIIAFDYERIFVNLREVLELPLNELEKLHNEIYSVIKSNDEMINYLVPITDIIEDDIDDSTLDSYNTFKEKFKYIITNDYDLIKNKISECIQVMISFENDESYEVWINDTKESNNSKMYELIYNVINENYDIINAIKVFQWKQISFKRRKK